MIKIEFLENFWDNYLLLEPIHGKESTRRKKDDWEIPKSSQEERNQTREKESIWGALSLSKNG